MADILMDTVGGKFVADTTEAQKSLEKLTGDISKLDKAMKLVGFGVLLKGIQAIGRSCYKAMSQMNDYIETLNLFRATMGQSTQAATEFVNKAEEVLGLDSSMTMKSVAMLQTLAEGYGLANEEAYIMSKNLTQLAADMSSFLNIPFDTALDKVKSGLAGEVKAMRNVGVALDKATLQQTMHRLGIEQTYSSLTRAQKTELIYYQIMTSTTKMQGDLARTMISPQNAIRILQQEFTRLARAIGSIFIPIAMKIIPVVRAITQVLIQAAKAIASFFGFNIGDYEADISTVGTLLDGVGGEIDDIGDSAGSAAKELQKMLMPFDELNNITLEKPGSGGGSGSGGIGGGGSLGIPLPEYDMFSDATKEMTKKIEAIKKGFEEWLPVLKMVALAFADIWLTNKIVDVISAINNARKALGLFTKAFPGVSTALKIGFGIVLALESIYLEYDYVRKLMDGEVTLPTLLEGTGSAFLAALAVGLTTGNIPLAALVGGTVAVVNLGLAVAVQVEGEDKAFEDLQKIADDVNNYLNPVMWGFNLLDWLQKDGLQHDIYDVYDTTRTLDPNTWDFTLIDWMQTEEGQTRLNELNDWIQDHLNPTLWVFNLLDWMKTEEGQTRLNELNDWIQNHLNPVLWTFSLLDWMKKDETQTKLNEIATWIGNHLNPFMWAFNLVDWIKKGEVDTKLNEIATWIGNHLNPFMWAFNLVDWADESGVKDTIKRIVNFITYWLNPVNWGISIGNWLQKQFSNIKLPSFTSAPTYNDYVGYATGGFPETGQFFYAREDGPELIGNIGNRTAVANNDQITQGIATATYNAFARAMAENGGNNNVPSTIVVNVGNEKLYEGYGEYQDNLSNMYGVTI